MHNLAVQKCERLLILGSRNMPAKWVRIDGDETGKINALVQHGVMLFAHLRLPKPMNNPKFFLPRVVSEDPDVSLKLSANDVYFPFSVISLSCIPPLQESNGSSTTSSNGCCRELFLSLPNPPSPL